MEMNLVFTDEKFPVISQKITSWSWCPHMSAASFNFLWLPNFAGEMINIRNYVTKNWTIQVIFRLLFQSSKHWKFVKSIFVSFFVSYHYFVQLKFRWSKCVKNRVILWTIYIIITRSNHPNLLLFAASHFSLMNHHSSRDLCVF